MTKCKLWTLALAALLVAWAALPALGAQSGPGAPADRYSTLSLYLVRHLDDAMVACALDGKVVYANQRYQQMLGYTLAELRKLTYQELTPARWHAMEDRLRQEQVMKRGFCDEYQKEYIRKDGKVIPIVGRAWLVRDEHGKPRWLLGIYRLRR